MIVDRCGAQVELIENLVFALTSHGEVQLASIFEVPVVQEFVLELGLTLADEAAAQFGILGLPLKGVVNLVDQLGGDDALLAWLRQEWPKMLREALDGGKKHEPEKVSRDHEESEEATLVGEAESRLDHLSSSTVAVGRSVNRSLERAYQHGAQTQAATAVQKIYRGFTSRQLMQQKGGGKREQASAVRSVDKMKSAAASPSASRVGTSAEARPEARTIFGGRGSPRDAAETNSWFNFKSLRA